MLTFQDIKIEDANVQELKEYCRTNDIKIKLENGKEVAVSNGKATRAYIIATLKKLNILSIPDTKHPAIEVTPTITKEQNIMEILGLTQTESLEIESALKASNLPLNEFIKLGALMKARKVNTEFQKVSTMSPEQLRQTTLSGAAFSNLSKTAEKIIAWNQACYNNDLRVYINASIMRNLTGSNLNTIKDFLENYRINQDEFTTIEEHNKYFGLTENDNRKGRDEFGNRIKIEDLINQATAKPVIAIPQENTVVVSTPVVEKPVINHVPVVENTVINPTPVVEKATINPTPALENIVVNPKEFAKLIDALETEQEIKALCEAKMAELRSISSSVHSLHKEVGAYRKELGNLKLTAINTYRHELANPHTLTQNETIKPGCEYNEAGQLIAEPKHVALKYLVLSQEENNLRNKKAD